MPLCRLPYWHLIVVLPLAADGFDKVINTSEGENLQDDTMMEIGSGLIRSFFFLTGRKVSRYFRAIVSQQKAVNRLSGSARLPRQETNPTRESPQESQLEHIINDSVAEKLAALDTDTYTC